MHSDLNRFARHPAPSAHDAIARRRPNTAGQRPEPRARHPHNAFAPPRPPRNSEVRFTDWAMI